MIFETNLELLMFTLCMLHYKIFLRKWCIIGLYLYFKYKAFNSVTGACISIFLVFKNIISGLNNTIPCVCMCVLVHTLTSEICCILGDLRRLLRLLVMPRDQCMGTAYPRVHRSWNWGCHLWVKSSLVFHSPWPGILIWLMVSTTRKHCPFNLQLTLSWKRKLKVNMWDQN